MIDLKRLEELEGHFQGECSGMCRNHKELMEILKACLRVVEAAKEMDNPYVDYGRLPIKQLRKALAPFSKGGEK